MSQILEEESERSIQSRIKNKERGQNRVARREISRCNGSSKIIRCEVTEMMLAHKSGMMMTQKATDAALTEIMMKPLQSNRPVKMLDSKKLTTGNTEDAVIENSIHFIVN